MSTCGQDCGCTPGELAQGKATELETWKATLPRGCRRTVLELLHSAVARWIWEERRTACLAGKDKAK